MRSIHPTSQPLRVLHLEDSPEDAELIRLRLEREQIPFQIVLTRGEADFAQALKEQTFDIILSDCALSGYDGRDALLLARRERPETPFMFVCGSIDEEQVILTLKEGARDYVLKHQLNRLGPTIRRLLEERKGQQNDVRDAAFIALGRQLSSASTPIEAAEIIVQTADELLGWDACSVDLCQPGRNLIFPVLEMDVLAGNRSHVPPSYSGVPPSPLVGRVLQNGGELILRDLSLSLSSELIPFGDASRPSASLMFVPIRNGDQTIGVLSIQSYTPNAYDHDGLATLQALADHCGGALERVRGHEALARLAAIIESSGDAIVGKDLQGTITSWNAAAARMFGYSATEALGKSITILLPPDRADEEIRILDKIRAGERVEPFETVRLRRDGQLIDIWATISPIKDGAGKVIGASAIAHDITARKKNESRLAALSQLGRQLSAAASPKEAAHIIADVAEGLFAWDALAVMSYSAEEDKMRTILSMDTIKDVKQDLTTSLISSRTFSPSKHSRRAMGLGAELILKEPPLQMISDETPFGDVTRPSASIMRVVIQHRQQIIGLLSLHSYTLKAYDDGDLSTLQIFADYCAGAFERMRAEEKNAALHTQLLNAARRAGMEEVANNVLHNVGNVLTSVNVSATLVKDSLAKSKLDGLSRVAALMREHIADLGKFVTENPQGVQLPGYLQTLAEYRDAEQSATLKELETLEKNLLHIKNIINRQQSLASAANFAQSVFVSDLLEDAMAIGAPDLARCSINISREYTVHFPAILDRLKLMLILVNLVSNARDALVTGNAGFKQLKVRTEIQSPDRLRILISDNGIGMSPDNLKRIFSHGFSTKKTGHGFGLHSSLLSARELGGTLIAESDGLGKGARFIVDLPLQSTKKSAP